MEKVKVTQEQAEAIQRLVKKYGTDGLLEEHAKYGFAELRSFSVPDLARALYIGYEVEPEFIAGDLVGDKNLNDVVIEITEIKEHGYQGFWMDGNAKVPTFLRKENAIQLTESEIAQEKQRRWWAKHGRGVWDLKWNDILSHKELGSMREVYVVVDNAVQFKGLGRNYIDLKTLKNEYEVVCFAEDRKDR